MSIRYMRTAATFIAVAVLAAACGGGGQGDANSGEKITINLDYQAAPAPTDPWHHMATTWKDLLEQESDGRIELMLFSGGQLSGGNQQEEISLVQNGTIDAAILPSSILTTIDPRFLVVGMPWIVPTQESVDTLIDGPLGAQTMEWIEEHDLVPLAIGSNGFRQLGNAKRSVSSPGDLDGLKIRVPGSQVLLSTWTKLGAQPTTVDFAELYTALQQGTVDGEELPLPYKVSTKFYEVEKYVTILNYAFDLIYLTVSPSLWDSLSEQDRDLVMSTAAEAAQAEREFVEKAEETAVAELKNNGVTVTTLTPDQIREFQDAVASVYDEFADEIGPDVLQAWQDGLAVS